MVEKPHSSVRQHLFSMRVLSALGAHQMTSCGSIIVAVSFCFAFVCCPFHISLYKECKYIIHQTSEGWSISSSSSPLETEME